MPNHVTNTLELSIDGENYQERLVQILSEIKGDDPEGAENQFIDFNKIVPMPQETIDSHDVPLTGDVHRATAGVNWYDWSIDNWSTKWNAYSQSISDCDYGCVTLTFDTAWSTPAKVIIALKEKYPDLHIGGGWIEEGWQSVGTFYDLLHEQGLL